jgi:hypothetical protein
MVDLTTRLTKKALLLAKIETTLGVDASPATSDCMEVADPDYRIDAQILERNYVADDLSPFANIVGRKQATITFTSELKGNGLQQSGNVADAPVMMRLMQACGYAISGMTTASQRIGDVTPDHLNSASQPTITWAKAGTVVNTKPMMYTVTVTTGGASATAKFTVRGNDETYDLTADDAETGAITSGTTAIALGTSGATITPTWTGTLLVGSVYHVVVMPVGLKLKPISTGQPTLTIYLYMDGVLHVMTAARGNAKITAEAGNFAKIEFTFQGNFVAAADAVAPSNPPYDTTLPQQVELSNLTWNNQRDLVAQQWTFDQGNTLTPRPDVNANEGVKGVRITARQPVGGFNPEATLEADYPFWADIEQGRVTTFFVKVGQVVGNTVAVWMPKVQMTAMPYGDRDGIRIYDVSFRATRFNGDDEVCFYYV